MNTDLTIVVDDKPIDCTYFRTSDIAPVLDGNELIVQDWKGSRRRWGTPSVRSEVSRLSDNIYQITVVGWHKHTVSPVGGNFYFVRGRDGWQRRTANHGAVKAALATIK